MNIVLKFEDEWIRQSENEGQLIPAWIYLQRGKECYPSDDWIDNPARLLGWWMHSITEIILDREGQGLSFMEGPFFIEVISVNDDLILTSEDKKISWTVNKYDLAKELIRASNVAGRKFYDEGFKELSDDINIGVNSLRVALKKKAQNN